MAHAAVGASSLQPARAASTTTFKFSNARGAEAICTAGYNTVGYIGTAVLGGILTARCTI
ncbi:MAG: hypothetical protein ACXWUB_12180 [Burkholderiales bacterium]